MLYKNLPRNVGLKRLTLHKSATGPNVNYILLVECSHFLDNINQVRRQRLVSCPQQDWNISLWDSSVVSRQPQCWLVSNIWGLGGLLSTVETRVTLWNQNIQEEPFVKWGSIILQYTAVPMASLNFGGIPINAPIFSPAFKFWDWTMSQGFQMVGLASIRLTRGYSERDKGAEACRQYWFLLEEKILLVVVV